ncbi:MAG: hypothetical protein QOE87_20 [Gaiellales bacterium]|nr:hypothetical protein [Gaiellales bacterium]
MIDSLGERLALANPVPATVLGEIHAEFAHELIQDISRPARVKPSRRRRLAIALLVALAIAAPVALAASHSHLLDFAIGDPAPSDVRAQLDTMLQPDFGPKEGPPLWRSRKDLIRSSARVVAQTTTSTGVVAHMYAVDLRRGGWCWITTGKPFGGGGCGGAALERSSAIGGGVGMRFAGMGKRESGTFGQGVTYFGRAGAPGVVSLRIEFKDGAADSIPVHDGWFMYEVPLPQTHWGHEPVKAEALDTSGRVVASVEDPLGLHPPVQPEPEHLLEPRELLARLPLGWQGASLELWLARGSKGDDCIQVRNTANRQTRRWLCDPAVGRDSAVGLQPPSAKAQPVYYAVNQFTRFGRPGGYIYASGWAGPPVASLEIRFQDSTVHRLTLHRGYFIYVVPEGRWALGKRPSYLIGRDAAGRIVYRRFLYPAARCAYPVRDPRCSNVIMHSG